jgi:hypothetical protein|tara:strand:- start:76 stop:858 length:783 start_codon:yes stop_codon:yes gene_type:complete
MKKSICIVTYCNEAYLDAAKQTICDLRIVGEYQGDIVLMIGNDLKNKELDVQKENVIVKYFPDVDRTEAIKIYEAFSESMTADRRETEKPFQWHMIHCFKEYFKRWEKCLVIDAGMKIHKPIEKILNIECGENLLAHSDSYPQYDWKLSGQFDKEYFPELYDELSSKHNLDVDYFQAGIVMYNTSLIRKNTFNEIRSLEKKYVNTKTNEQAILNIYFNCQKKIWKQIPLGDKKTLYYDAHLRDHLTTSDFIMTKRNDHGL